MTINITTRRGKGAKLSHDEMDDNLTNLHGAIGCFAGEYGISGNTTLNRTHAGKYAYITNAGGYTINLPDPADYPFGTSFHFYNASASNVTIAATAGQLLSPGRATPSASITLGVGNTLTVYWNGDSWFMVSGTSTLKYSEVFSSLNTANGWQLLPSGLIIQWGTVIPPDGFTTVSQTVGFPITFPTACLSVVTSFSSSIGNIGAFHADYLNVLAKTTSSVTFGLSGPRSYIAIGY